jgi:hypothetical protein
MLRLAGAALVAALTLLGAAGIASSQSERVHGEVWVGLKGWGGVKLGKGVLQHRTVSCTRESCPAVNYLTRGARVVLSEKPYTGWKFVRWHGACKGTKTTCTIHISKARPNAFGERQVRVSATFVPFAPGLTRNKPIPPGTDAAVGNGWHVRINSVLPNAQLFPPPPAGADYFAANVTIGYSGQGSSTPENYLTWQATGTHHITYDPGSDPCPNQGPQPPLDTYDPVLSGQSVSGYVCWEIQTSDASSLELFFGSGGLNYPGTTWFALH